MQVNIAINKISKFGKSDGGDTVEVVERPRGGISIVLSDGQGSGAGAKRISSLVVSKAVSLIGDGTRDGAVARAVHDYLFTLRYGKVSATLSIVSIDQGSGTLVISRNSDTPVIVAGMEQGTIILEDESPNIGIKNMIRPDINQFSLISGIRVALFSDGLLQAGGNSANIIHWLKRILEEKESLLQEKGEKIFAEVLQLEKLKPRDDITLSLLELEKTSSPANRVKRYHLSFPLQS